MFAVPGWNVSAPIKAQVEVSKPKDPNKLGKKAQKRKQNQQKKQEDQVNADNLVEQWEKNFQAGKGDEPKEQSKEAPKPVGQEAKSDTSDQRGQKRKRGQGKDKNTSEGNAKGAEDSSKDSQPTTQQPSAPDSQSESKRDKKKRKKEQQAAQKSQQPTPQTSDLTTPLLASSLTPEPKGLTPLQKSMRAKLASARFRHLNESLYTKPSATSLDLFKDDPSMFEDYHRGFAQQVEVWPENPVDGYVSAILARGKNRVKDPWKDKKRAGKKGKKGGEADTTAAENNEADTAPVKPLPRNLRGHSTIADLGCGTASLSYRLQPHLKALNLSLHSFDLSKPAGPSGPLVTVSDISSLPLADGSVDVAIFCLALMGTNWLDFIDEAYRVLRWRGELWVAEIKSRFGRPAEKGGRKIPINSIGSLKKSLPPGSGKKDKKDGKKGKKDAEEEGIAGSEDEAELAVAVDGADKKEGTDVSAFVEVLRKRGFVLDAVPERPGDAIDLSNKMFVKMQFVKSAHPSRGKNAREDQKEGAGAKPEGLRMGMKGKKFGAVKDADDGQSEEKDKAVLKPCLYKIR